jgi:hypothetical protein
MMPPMKWRAEPRVAAFTHFACCRFLRVFVPASIGLTILTILAGLPRFCPLVWSVGFIHAHQRQSRFEFAKEQTFPIAFAPSFSFSDEELSSCFLPFAGRGVGTNVTRTRTGASGDARVCACVHTAGTRARNGRGADYGEAGQAAAY